jgi:prepilin-type processing-associated H-X9-DG protein
VDLSRWDGYEPGGPAYRHFHKANVGWLDGHVSSHFKSFVNRKEDIEEKNLLYGNERLIYWNRY